MIIKNTYCRVLLNSVLEFILPGQTPTLNTPIYMPFKVIKGRFHVVNYSPDGDSIRFEPDNAAFIKGLAGGRPRFNARNHIQLRIEAIDTLETHYTPPSGGGTYHQPLALAHSAAERLLDFVGIKDVRWDAGRKTVLSAADGTRGYILSRSVEKNGRPVAFVFAGEPQEQDGTDIMLSPSRMRNSYNYVALAEGFAYPTYYEGLFHDLRAELNAAVQKARTNGSNIYGQDRTNTGFDAQTLAAITEDFAIMPKLFRRLTEYMVNNGSAVGFKAKLAQSKERVLDLVEANFTHFDTFIEQADGSSHIRLTRLPEELIFDPMPGRPANAFSAIMNSEIVDPPRFIETITLPEEAVRDISV